VKTANAHALTPAWRHADRAVVRRDEAALTELVGGVSGTAAPRRRGGDFCVFDANSMIDAPASPTRPAGRAHRV